ncbi:MAG: sigma-E factor regulatory protein RseB domain-containing protein [Armatimonadota bacterium]
MNEHGLKSLFAQILTLSIIALTVAEPTSGGKPDPLSLLRRALNPSAAYTCKIVVTSWHSPKGDTALLREWRLPDGRYRIEYLSPQKLRGTVLLSDGKRRWRIVKGRAIWELEVDELTPERLDLLGRNYRLTVLKPTAVLNRKAWQISVTPKVKGKPQHRFWLDAEHGITLKGEVMGEDGTPIAFMAVTELKFLKPREIPKSLFEAPPKRLSRGESKQLTKQQAESKWEINLPNALPFGFVLERVEEVSLPRNLSALHAVYTDGLTRLSLFILPSNFSLSLSPSRVSMVRKRLGRQVLLLVGSIDKSLLERIVSSF